MTWFFDPLKSPLAKKLVWWFITIGTSVALFSTVVQLYLDYRDNVTDIRSYLDTLHQTYLPAISKNTWIMDDHQVLLLLSSITNRYDIVYAGIDVDGSTAWKSGIKPQSDRLIKQLPIIYHYNNQAKHIGTLTVIADIRLVYERLAKKIAIVLFTNTIKTFIVAALALMVVHLLVTRHLQAMARHVSGISLQSTEPELTLQKKQGRRKDELDAVAEALSSMQRRGYTSYREIAKAEQQLRIFLNATEEAVFGVDRQGDILFVNSTCLRMLGYDNEAEITGKNFSDIITFECLHKLHSAKGKNSLLQSVATGRTFSCQDGFLRGQTTNGFFVTVRAYPTFSNSTCTGSVIFLSDISQNRELRKQTELLSAALDYSAVSVFITDKNQVVVYTNPSFDQNLGGGAAKLVGKKIDTIVPQKPFMHTLQEGIASCMKGEPWQGRVEYDQGATKKFADLVISPISDTRGNIRNIISIAHDVTAEVELQNQLLNAQKLKALGRLSESIAHEFGNPLLGIQSLLKDFQQRPATGQDDRQLLDIAVSECTRMQSMISDINNFYGSEATIPTCCDIRILIDKILLFNQKIFLDHKITVKVKHEKNLPGVNGRKDQLAQVVFNIVLNAVDAMKDEGGTLEIHTSSTGQYLQVTFSDSGPGMSREVMDQIFEPFFSTKEEVEGTGLGLSVTYGIISSHGGSISCTSLKGDGTTFTIILPLDRQHDDQANPSGKTFPSWCSDQVCRT